MNVPEELAEYKLERAELAIALPADWKLVQNRGGRNGGTGPFKLKTLARLPHCQQYASRLKPYRTMRRILPKIHTQSCAPPFLTGPRIPKMAAKSASPERRRSRFYQVIPSTRIDWNISWPMTQTPC